MTSLVRNRNYRLLFSAHAITNLGDGVSSLAFPWLATLITRDPMAVAIVAAAVHLPWFLFSIPAGVITDRGDRRRLMVQADVLRLLLTFGVVALILTTPVFPPAGSPWPMIAALAGLAFLLGSAEVVRDNAAQTLLPSVVSEDALERANGRLWSVEQIMGSFVGPPLAGLLIAWAVPVPFVFDAVTFGLAAWLIWMLALPPRAQPKRRAVWSEAAEGWRWMKGHPVILRLAVLLGALNALNMMAMTVLVLFSQERLGLGAAGHGLLMTAGAAGGVVGGMICPWIVARLGGQSSLRLALILFPLPYLAIAVWPSVWVVAAALFLEMAAALLWNVVTVSYRQRIIPDDLLGRVNSLYRFFGWGMIPLGALAGGWIVSVAEGPLGRAEALSLPFLLAGAGLGGTLVYGWVKLRL